MHIHFIAIGGSAMHNLAIALKLKGETITGSDDDIFEPSYSRLKQHDILPHQMGWHPEQISNEIDLVILGMHAKSDNPELLKAQELGLKIYSYPEYLYEHSKKKTRVVIAGSHGKTTITSMILHVLNYHEKPTDFMVGAQLDGFDNMVHLTEENDFILLEGDEYLSSAIDPKPKFLWYQPNIALISGIAWDHVNVFPNFEVYKNQFEKFVESMTNGSTLVYNEGDDVLKDIALNATKPTRKHAYHIPEHHIEDGVTYLETNEGPMPIEVFGEHNLQNIAGAKWICQHMGVDEDDFYEAIASFKGASKRLEEVIKTPRCLVFKDYAHSPSKVEATTKAVKAQFPNKTLLVCFELHTYSSLTASFLKEYHKTLDKADEVVIFYSKKALKIKQMPELTKEQIQEAFNRDDLSVYTNAEDFKAFLKAKHFNNHVLLLMSSGNYGGLDFDELKEWV
ncbi:UDP-N-acetylmuramate--L-alanine ligase [Flavobacterium sp. CS20]|jgi:UDP-N-acetylmuramate: L-alanyl-gamma-D-glutamyl-meso-diaminopimelate ligase|uniref:UDP-N-acetylmuramate--L-alanine ligase n=1 Tax=Flavobacterium sp. CS20 TaxID=2775246 RepID=UPI001B39E132|nr:Mur ligase family protein [Flavobacterium sp. CS20]QTY26231.1 peptidoglycan synthetase [Flavobacterium sp. CS20]